MCSVGDSLVSSSSSDDFAAYLDAELDQVSSHETPIVDDENGSSNDDDFEQRSLKRQKVEQRQDRDISLLSDAAMTRYPTSSRDKHCSHPGFFRDMCMVCGQVKELSGVALGYIHKYIRLDAEEMARIKHLDLERKLMHDRKLYLVLDLDHTLLNSTMLVNVAPNEDHFKQGDSDADLFRLDRIHMLTKLRPFVHTFLREAYKKYEIHIYTMAERSYALEMAKLLDPTGIYFGDRIISQSDCTKRHQKGLDVVVGAENAVLILDDTDGVWQQHRDNLILMERYHYFASSSGQFGLYGKSLSERKMDESETDGALSTILKILEQVHDDFFFNLDAGTDIKERDVRMILKKKRREILRGCKIVFSYLFPSNTPAANQPLWKIAEELGAVCSKDVDPSVTHVVAGCRGTDKAKWALQENKFLVNPGWIEAANYLWKRLPEENFVVSQSRG